MSKRYVLFVNQPNNQEYIIMGSKKHYGLINFLGDLIMTGLTGGLWLIWVFVREMRNN